MENSTPRIFDELNDPNNDNQLLYIYMKSYMYLINQQYNRPFNPYNYIYKYGGVIGEYNDLNELVVVRSTKILNNDIIITFYYISVNNPTYSKYQFWYESKKQWHCDYYAGSGVTFQYLANYIYSRYCKEIDNYINE